MLAFCGTASAICGEIINEKNYRIKTPRVESVTFNPHPAIQNQSLSVSVYAADIEIFIPPKIIYCGTFNCGQEPI